MWSLSLVWKKQDPAEAEKECRICWGGDEVGEDWTVPCHCPHIIALVHRSCLEWRLKHTRIEEDKLQCVVCNYPYVKCLRFKSLDEWRDSLSGDWFMLQCDFYGLFYALYALLLFHCRAWFLQQYLWWWWHALIVYVFLPSYIFLAVAFFALHLYAAHRMPARFGLSLYKRFLAVMTETIGDAHPPPNSP